MNMSGGYCILAWSGLINIGSYLVASDRETGKQASSPLKSTSEDFPSVVWGSGAERALKRLKQPIGDGEVLLTSA